MTRPLRRRRCGRLIGRGLRAAIAVLGALAGLVLTPPVAATENHDGTLCTRAIRAAERRHDLPEGLLLALALTETGRQVGAAPTPWPWSVNAGGEGRWFDDRQAALDHARRLRAEGVASIDVGCMQVNLMWHEAAFASLEAAFEPRVNVAYAARHLAGLRAGARDWLEAAGRYHSWDEDRARAYLQRLRANWAVALDARNLQIVRLPAAPGRMALRFALPPAGQGRPFAAFPGAWPSGWSDRLEGPPLLLPAPIPEAPRSGS